MLRSTYQKKQEPNLSEKKSAELELPPGWTSHTAPTGHIYYYHKESKKSTYKRPVVEPTPTPIPNYSHGEYAGGFSSASFVTLPKPKPVQRRPEPIDRPKHRFKIPKCKPWVLVQTKLGRRFVHNTETNKSFWKFPEDVMHGVIELDRRNLEKKLQKQRGDPEEDESDICWSEDEPQSKSDISEQREDAENAENNENNEDDSEEFIEIEVTDSENDEEEVGGNDKGNPSKKQRIYENDKDDKPDEPVEFNEDDLAYELEDMEPYDEDYEQEELLTEEDCKQLFFDLLEDFKINPYSTWEKVIEQGQIFDDQRYTALPNMKSRKATWDEWSAFKIHELKEIREKQAKIDPKIPYYSFLQEHASTKLYWPEFKRKYKKEDIMKTSKIIDKDREKWYREYIKRLQLPTGALKSDFTALLKSLPLSILNRNTPMNNLPLALLTDMKYHSLSPSIREPLIEAYISTLDPLTTDQLVDDEQDRMATAKREDRERREKALADRERKVEAEKLRQSKELRYGKAKLRDEQIHLERAMNIDKSGLKSHFQEMDQS